MAWSPPGLPGKPAGPQSPEKGGWGPGVPMASAKQAELHRWSLFLTPLCCSFPGARQVETGGGRGYPEIRPFYELPGLAERNLSCW